MVADALAVIEAAGIEQVVPVAASHSGWVAIELRRRLGAGARAEDRPHGLDGDPALASRTWRCSACDGDARGLDGGARHAFHDLAGRQRRARDRRRDRRDARAGRRDVDALRPRDRRGVRAQRQPAGDVRADGPRRRPASCTSTASRELPPSSRRKWSSPNGIHGSASSAFPRRRISRWSRPRTKPRPRSSASSLAPEPIEHVLTQRVARREQRVLEVVGRVVCHPEPLHHAA